VRFCNRRQLHGGAMRRDASCSKAAISASCCISLSLQIWNELYGLALSSHISTILCNHVTSTILIKLFIIVHGRSLKKSKVLLPFVQRQILHGIKYVRIYENFIIQNIIIINANDFHIDISINGNGWRNGFLWIIKPIKLPGLFYVCFRVR